MKQVTVKVVLEIPEDNYEYTHGDAYDLMRSAFDCELDLQGEIISVEYENNN